MVVYRCQDSLEGVFTGIYRVYEDKVSREDALLSLTMDPFLFGEDRVVEPDPVRTQKVVRTLITRFGMEDYHSLCFTLSTPEMEKAQWVFHTVARGLERKTVPGHLMDDLADDQICSCFKAARNASREHCHLRGFTRFEELENGIMYARIAPKNNILTFLMPHFADRFPMEDFVLYDAGRGMFGIHPSGGRWYLMQGEEPEVKNSREEKVFQDLFRHFCDRIAIKERKNLDLQQNLLPLRFREFMTEFQ